MSSKKKLFESDDFDKRKKLFTSSDFDKESKDNIPVENSKDGEDNTTQISVKNEKSNLRNWIYIISGGIVVLCVIGFFIFSKSGDTAATDSAQETVIVEETIVPTDSVANQGEAPEEILTTEGNEVSNNTDAQEAKVNEIPVNTDNAQNIATTTQNAASNSNVSNDVEAEAMKVIRGDYGVGQVRKDKLGTKYQPIQSRVNELKREGIF